MKATTSIRLYLSLALCLLCWQTAGAQSVKDQFRPVQYAVTSLMIAPDARGAGFGDSGAATEADVNSQFWNPAKYPFAISRAGAAINYTPWLRQLVNDMGLASIAGYYRLGDYSALSASLRYFTLGEIGYDWGVSGDGGMTLKPYEMAFDVGISRMLSETFSVAVTGRYILSDLKYDFTEDTSPGSAFAADISAYYNDYFTIGSRECQLALGMNVSNIGTKISFGGDNHSEFIPTNLRLGLNFAVPLDEYNKLTFVADANKLLIPTYPDSTLYPGQDYNQVLEDHYYNVSSISGIFKSFSDAPGGFKEELQEIQWSVGAEYSYNDKFAVRAGYHHESENKGNRKYFTIGAGFKMSVFSLDVGYVIATSKSNPLDQTMRFTLAFDMDGIKDLFGRGN